MEVFASFFARVHRLCVTRSGALACFHVHSLIVCLTSILLSYVSIMATILYLFTESEMKGEAPMVRKAQYSKPRAWVPADSRVCRDVLDPCKACPMAGLCDSDECGMKGFPIDSPFPSTRFPNLGAYVDFLKHYGWL